MVYVDVGINLYIFWDCGNMRVRGLTKSMPFNYNTWTQNDATFYVFIWYLYNGKDETYLTLTKWYLKVEYQFHINSVSMGNG